MEDVEKIVLKMIGSQTSQNQYNLFKMKACWADIIGKNNAKHCSPVKLERRILILQVDSSVWSNQFLFYKEQLIKQINMFMKNEYVKEIKFVLGQSFKRNKIITKRDREKNNKINVPPLTDEEKKAIEIKFSNIKNEKIRNIIIGIEEKRTGLEKLYREGKIKKCPFCGAYLKNSKEKICYLCRMELKNKKEIEIRKKIKKEPWIRWSDLNRIIACDEIDFNFIKSDMESYYFEKVRLKRADENEEKFAVQLKAGKPFALISEKEYENILKFLQKGK